MEHEFWNQLDDLIMHTQVIIDRPAGQGHPSYPEMVYPVDYGYLIQTTSSDGEGIDLFRGSDSGQLLNGLVCTLDLQKQESEIKLLVGCTAEEQNKVVQFLRNHGMPALLIKRDENPLSWLLSRRSVRRFTKKNVPSVLVEKILEAAIQAPSAHNRQPARFVVIQKIETKRRLAEAMGGEFLQDLLQDGVPEAEAKGIVARSRQRITEAPTVILVCLESGSLDEYPDQKRQEAEYKMAVQGVAMSAENLLLAAHTLGLGAVWLCAPLFTPETVGKTLLLPDSWEPQGLILLGYPEKYPKGRPRRSIAEVTRFD